VLLRDVRHFVRQGHVVPPTGFTKLGLPVLFFPEESAGRGSSFATVSEGDLHLLGSILQNSTSAENFSEYFYSKILDKVQHKNNRYKTLSLL
jgi:hypothetical protein